MYQKKEKWRSHIRRWESIFYFLFYFFNKGQLVWDEMWSPNPAAVFLIIFVNSCGFFSCIFNKISQRSLSARQQQRRCAFFNLWVTQCFVFRRVTRPSVCIGRPGQVNEPLARPPARPPALQWRRLFAQCCFFRTNLSAAFWIPVALWVFRETSRGCWVISDVAPPTSNCSRCMLHNTYGVVEDYTKGFGSPVCSSWDKKKVS